MAMITLALTTYFILTQSYLVAIIVVLGGYTIYQLAHQEPEVLPVTFSTDGVKFKGKVLPFSTMKTFWITEHGPNARRLYLQQIDRFSTPLVIPIVKHDVEKVRDFLKRYIPESHNVKEDMSEKLNRWLRI